MPIQAKCPGCQTVLRVPDTARGKKVRCSSCQKVFSVGGASPAAPSQAVRAAPSAIRSKPAATGARPRPADDERSTPKKKKSWLPTCLIGCGVLLVLCGGGGSIGSYFAWRALNRAADEARENVKAKERELADAIEKDAQRERELQEQFHKAAHDLRNQLQNPVKLPDNPRPPDNLNPPPNANPNPAPRRAGGEVVQSVAQTIPLDAQTINILAVLWSGAEANQVVVVAGQTEKTLRLDRFDLAGGKKMDSLEMPYDFFTSIRDISPDCKHYVCNNGGSPYSVYAWPDPKPLVDRWQPQPPRRVTPSGLENMVVAAHLLGGGRLLTVNGMGQVVIWSLPTAAGTPPKQELFYDPPASVAKYPAGLGLGLTSVSADRKRLAVFNGNDGYFLLDIDGLKLHGVVKSPEDAKSVPNTAHYPLGAAFSPDGVQLAAVFDEQRQRGKAPPPSLVRWDVAGKERTARLSDPSRGRGSSGSRVSWWSSEFCWLLYLNSTALVSWEKPAHVLVVPRTVKVWPGSPDGKCWFTTATPDGKSALKCVDLPAVALRQADKPLRLTADGIVRR